MIGSNPESLKQTDIEIFNLIGKELKRQEEGLELIASENYASPAVMAAQGSLLTNKYAEGYPQKRYYGGCEFIDSIEQLAIDRACKLFDAKFANVQPHSGSQANMAAYFSLCEVGDKILGMNLSEGGHLTHGSPVNFSGKLFKIISYGLDLKSETLDYHSLEKIAQKERPKLIVAGASAYSKIIDFEKFRQIADSVGAFLMVDMAHIAGLIAADLHPSPIPHAHVITSTTHKTLRGPRGGLILTNSEEIIKKINFNVFPGIQGGPLEHVIGAKAVAFKEALTEEFKTYQKQVVKNAHHLAESLKAKGLHIVSNGTDNHLLMLKTENLGLNGKQAEKALEAAGLTTNKNMIPGDKRSPFVTSGIRMGTPAITTRGLKEEHMELIAHWIFEVLKNHESPEVLEKIQKEVQELCNEFPVYKNNS